MSADRPLRVLLVSHEYPPFGVAGVERLTEETAKELSRRNHEVAVFTRRPGPVPPLLSLERETRGPVTVLTLAGGGTPSAPFPGDASNLEGWFERLLVEIDPDVVLVTHLLYHSPAYVSLAHRWDVPVVLELHDFFMACPLAHLQRVSGEACEGPEGGEACATHCFPDMESSLLRWSLRARSFAEAIRAADLVLTPSRFLADRFQALRPAASPIEVVGNSVRSFGPVLRSAPDPEKPLHLASIGVTTPHKGFHVVVDALRLARLPAARYTIFGRTFPDYERELRSAAAEAPGLELRLFDRFEPDQLPALLAEVDALVVPSVVPETFSIVAREAFACGVPVIASRLGALPEAVREGENGWLFEPGSSLDLAVLLQRLDCERDLLRKAATGISPADTVSVGARTDRIEEMLRRVVASSARQGSWEEQRDLGLMRAALSRSDGGR